MFIDYFPYKELTDYTWPKPQRTYTSSTITFLGTPSCQSKHKLIWENDSFTFTFDVPGYTKEHVDVEFTDGVLTCTLHPKEGSDVRVQCALKDVDPETFKAKCENGQLVVTGEKLTKCKKVTIAVE